MFWKQALNHKLMRNMAKGGAEAIAALTGFVKNLYDMIQGGDSEAIEVRLSSMSRLRKFFGAALGRCAQWRKTSESRRRVLVSRSC